MPEIKNCKRCNKIFSYVAGPPICPVCQKEDEKLFEDVCLYIRDHPGMPLTVVSKEMNMSYDKLMKYVRDGRLQIRAANGTLISFCEKCGAEIASGRFCKDCEGGLTKSFESSSKKLSAKLESQKSGSEYQFFADVKKK